MITIQLNPGDLLTGPAGRIALITKLKKGSYTHNTDEHRVYAYINELEKESFLAYENDIKDMIEKGIWKHYRVVE